MNIQEIKSKDMSWVNIINPTQEEIEHLRKTYKFHPLDLEDCLTVTQRPKIDEYEKYHFMVLLFPIYHTKTREITPEEIHFFISKHYLITIHNNVLSPVTNFFHLCQSSQEVRKKHFDGSAEKLLYHVLDKLLTSIYPMLDHLSVDISQVEKGIFAGDEKKMVKEILVTRRNITDFRKIMQAHKKTLQKLTAGLQESDLFQIQKTDRYFDNLVDHTKEIWDALEGYKEAIEALQETNESLISNRINEIMKTLTAISVAILPVTLIASLFGMNTPNSPFSNQPHAFWIITAMNLLIMAGLIFFLKKKRWI
ncbi:MAG: hypothetical protein COY66_03030 [Candidatus Kerfeldbacteria bacterium CG_4_10_14_0_8_um_filter_42_10]|uniref:Magnesium transporter n=1 Tax=Candidatus Kerfeldbacteria bacterium CG_4_10_14_0_8_um_filter_42_10 TaxID=2014248 RepID=A0A2M7RJN4_9BACT|nr:MAG: hypothetical protein COY66_03030 [Candidatus Kerfeldbacteria bacterium CG_4_10_14_0_8_um_filter_42_10]